MNNTKLVSQMSNEEIEMTILEEVIEVVGLSIAPDNKLFAKVIDSSKNNVVTLSAMMNTIHTLALLKDGQAVVKESNHSLKHSTNLKISFMSTFDIVTDDVTDFVLSSIENQNTKVADEVRKNLANGRVFKTAEGFTIIRDRRVTQLAYEKIEKILDSKYLDAGRLIMKAGLWYSWCDTQLSVSELF